MRTAGPRQNTADKEDPEQSTDNAQEIVSLKSELDSLNSKVCDMSECYDKLTKERDNLQLQLTCLEDKLKASEVNKVSCHKKIYRNECVNC